MDGWKGEGCREKRSSSTFPERYESLWRRDSRHTSREFQPFCSCSLVAARFLARLLFLFVCLAEFVVPRLDSALRVNWNARLFKVDRTDFFQPFGLDIRIRQIRLLVFLVRVLFISWDVWMKIWILYGRWKFKLDKLMYFYRESLRERKDNELLF